MGNKKFFKVYATFSLAVWCILRNHFYRFFSLVPYIRGVCSVFLDYIKESVRLFLTLSHYKQISSKQVNSYICNLAFLIYEINVLYDFGIIYCGNITVWISSILFFTATNYLYMTIPLGINPFV